jgi:hypothetical protein
MHRSGGLGGALGSLKSSDGGRLGLSGSLGGSQQVG